MNGKSVITLQPVAVPAITINLGDQQALVKSATDALALAKDMEIDSFEMAEQAQAEVATWCRTREAIDAWRKGITKPIDDAKKHVMEFVRPAVDGLQEAEDLAKGKVARWQRAERDRVERERREAEERARRDRERLEAEAREKRRQADQAAAEAAAKAKAAEEAQDGAERARLQREADAAAKLAEEHLDDAATSAAISQVVVAAPVQEAARVSGFRFTDKIEMSVVDKLALIQWVAAHAEFVDLLDANLSALKSLQKAMKDRFNVPGVEVTKDLGASRASRAA